MHFFEKFSPQPANPAHREGQNLPDFDTYRRKKPADCQKVHDQTKNAPAKRKQTELPAAGIEGKQQIARKIGQGIPEIEQMRQPADAAAQSTQQVIVHAEGQSQQHRQ